MKKILLFAPLLFALCSISEAQVSDVRQVIKSSAPIHNVTISSSTATQVDATAFVLTQRNFVAVQNQDPLYNIWCHTDQSQCAVNKGIVIPAGYPLYEIPITYGSRGYAPSPAYVPTLRLTLWCISENPAGTGQIGVLQGY